MEAMVEFVAAMKSMAALLESVKSTVDESQHMLREMVRKPQDDGALREMRFDITTPRFNPIPRLDPANLHVRAIPTALEGGKVAAAENGDEGRPDRVVPARCSTFGVGPDAGGVEAVASPLQPRISDLRTTLPTRCSRQFSITEKEDVQGDALQPDDLLLTM